MDKKVTSIRLEISAYPSSPLDDEKTEVILKKAAEYIFDCFKESIKNVKPNVSVSVGYEYTEE